jgi:hypothetical protein
LVCGGDKKGEIKLWNISGDAHDSLDGVGIELARLSLDELELEATMFYDDRTEKRRPIQFVFPLK